MSKTIFLTGSTSGIGKATAIGVVNSCKNLILPVRNINKGNSLKAELNAINPNCQIDLYECNLESMESVKNCAEAIASKYKLIDILINNAGILDYQCRFTADGLEGHFQVNVLSQCIFNTILKPLVIASEQGRIINISGVSHKLGKFDLEFIQDQNHTKPSIKAAYQLIFDSCLYRNLLTFKLAKELEDNKVTVNCLHPGAINTNIAKDGASGLGKVLNSVFSIFAKSPEEGAKTTLYLALSKEGGEISGKYWSDCKVAKPSQLSMDMELADQLAGKCTGLTGV
jgi:NAD(P)-dependent dehydrogenase (short-subunit alcohol dehydrogenase family)